MGMAIDEAIPKIQFVRNALNDDTGIAKAYDIAIDTMHKYQKIEQILKDIPYGGEVTVRRIQEVIEDGNVD